MKVIQKNFNISTIGYLNKKTKKLLVVFVTVLLVAMVFGVVWFSTSDIRFRNSCFKDIEEEMDEYRADGRGSFIFFVYDSLRNDSKYQDFLVSKVIEMCEKNEYGMLGNFLYRLEADEYYCSRILEIIEEKLNNSSDYIQVLSICSAIHTNDYYNANETVKKSLLRCLTVQKDVSSSLRIIDILKRYNYYDDCDMSNICDQNSGMIARYIEEQGIKSTTLTTGSGYYANKKDEFSKGTVGVSGSPLYNATSVKYFGDFKRCVESGVELNGYYEETGYSRVRWYFKDIGIGFDPTEGNCVWSGDYLFCFSDDGKLLNYELLDKLG